MLLSVKPRFAEQILAGTKKVEFRRSWAAEPVGLAVVYSSSPVQRLVGIVEIEGTVIASPVSVWTKCRGRGPGLERQELMEYFAGKDQAYGILLGKLARPEKPIRPTSLFRGFRPPQSFRYLTAAELRRIGKQFGIVEKSE
ncbi:ASCH domain-containing protein [Pandoraea apista]|uniref:ASCH domain-containing protein n=1 Tax=Pandoraea apista TaxID=93218 RepID=UPI00248D456B|nr:ASCH domain-containing protein [Pandoraea apista]